MAVSSNLLLSQTDFSGGQVNNASRRRDTPAVKAGGAIMKNWRALDSAQIVQRSGRRTLFASQGARSKCFRMSSSVVVELSFSTGAVAITDLAGNPQLQSDGVTLAIASSPNYLWTNATLAQIYLTQALTDIVICYPGMRPQILRWQQSTNTWSFLQFAFTTGGNQVYEPFYRFSVPGASMTYDATTGNTNLVCSQPYFTPAMTGSILSLVGQQCQILQVSSPTTAIATISYALPAAIAVTVANIAPFQVGQVVENSGTPSYKFEVGTITPGTGTTGVIAGVLRSSILYPAVTLPTGDQLESPVGSSTVSAVAQGSLPQPTIDWQEEFMSALRGWPQSCFYDQGRLGFCNFPQLGEALLWSSTNASYTFWIDDIAAALQPEAGANADSAILELIPQKPQVLHVVGWSDGEFVFTDRGIYQIPLSTAQPLRPGNVSFQQFSNDGVSNIPPITTQDAIVYINAGLRRASCVRATGAYSRPYITDDLSDEHSDLFNSPYAMTIATGDGQHEERYIYLVNADGSVIVGKFTADRTFVGWAPWISVNPVAWVDSFGPTVFFTSTYATGTFIEQEDDTIYFDAAIFINAPPANLKGPISPAFSSGFSEGFAVGSGPLWPLANLTVQLMDGTLDRGDRQVDQNGYLVGIQGEDLSSPTLVAGLFTENRFQPFSQGGAAGSAQGQRQRRRKISRAMATVQNHSGFILGNKIFPAYQWGEDQSQAPVLKNGSYETRPIGHKFDPTIDLVKDRPGPITLCEFSMEITP